MDAKSIPFTLRGVSGQIHVSLVINDDPLRYGCDLLDPDLPPDAAQGYPICRAEIEHDADGYAAAMGWVQLVRSTDAAPEFEMDPLALFRQVASPFAFFGIKPTMFDAPFRDEKYDCTWRAETFLCAILDGVMSQHAQPLAGLAGASTCSTVASLWSRPRCWTFRRGISTFRSCARSIPHGCSTMSRVVDAQLRRNGRPVRCCLPATSGEPGRPTVAAYLAGSGGGG